MADLTIQLLFYSAKIANCRWTWRWIGVPFDMKSPAEGVDDQERGKNQAAR
jgi:hypothetical protein